MGGFIDGAPHKVSDAANLLVFVAGFGCGGMLKSKLEEGTLKGAVC